MLVLNGGFVKLAVTLVGRASWGLAPGNLKFDSGVNCREAPIFNFSSTTPHNVKTSQVYAHLTRLLAMIEVHLSIELLVESAIN
jgi:hypothetical protein